MKDQIIISLYDYTTETVKPWANAGYHCYCVDLQHGSQEPPLAHGSGTIQRLKWDLHGDLVGLMEYFSGSDVKLVLGFPVCTDMAVSGAAHFARKAAKDPKFQKTAAKHAIGVARFANCFGAPFMIENPVSVLATLWRKPDFYFHPYEFGGYIPLEDAEHPLYPDHIAPRDAYTKKTGIWSGNGFKRPQKDPVSCETYGASRQHRLLGGSSMKTKNIRSATPRGFAKAVFEANQ